MSYTKTKIEGLDKKSVKIGTLSSGDFVQSDGYIYLIISVNELHTEVYSFANLDKSKVDNNSFVYPIPEVTIKIGGE